MRQGVHFSAAFDRAEIEGKTRLLGHVRRIVEHDNAAVADETVPRRKGFIVERRVEIGAREVGAERSANLHGFDRAARCRAPADVVDKFAKRDAEGHFEEAAMLQVAGELDRHRAARAAHAVVVVGFGALRRM